MMSKGNRRVWSRVAVLSIHQPLSPSSRSLFHLLRSSYPPVVCATFALSLSFHRTERAESSVSNSRTRTSRSLCEYYSALHSRFFLSHNALPRCALTFKGENVDTVLFSSLALFYINSPFLFAAIFCSLLYRAMSITKAGGGNAVTVFMCIRKIRCVSRDGIANGGAM